MASAVAPRYHVAMGVTGKTGNSILAKLTAPALLFAIAPQLFAAMPPAEARRMLQDGFDHFYNLEYDAALANFQTLRADDPRNPSWQNDVALGYFYKELYQAGALEGDLFDASNRFFRNRKFAADARLEDGFRRANQTAIEMCDRRLQDDPKDKDALYACGVAYATRATHEGLVVRSAFRFLGAARRANEYHSRLIRIDPQYNDGYLIPGVYQFVLGSLPRAVKMLFFFAGMTGDKQRGLELVERAARLGDGARYDAQILLAVMYRREHRYADARRVLEQLEAAFPRNYIVPLEIASLHRAAGELPQAIETYQAVLAKMQAGTPNYSEAPAARIHFELGELYRRKGDFELARDHLTKVAGARGSTAEMEKAAVAMLDQMKTPADSQNR